MPSLPRVVCHELDASPEKVMARIEEVAIGRAFERTDGGFVLAFEAASDRIGPALVATLEPRGSKTIVRLRATPWRPTRRQAKVMGAFLLVWVGFAVLELLMRGWSSWFGLWWIVVFGLSLGVFRTSRRRKLVELHQDVHDALGELLAMREQSPFRVLSPTGRDETGT